MRQRVLFVMYNMDRGSTAGVGCNFYYFCRVLVCEQEVNQRVGEVSQRVSDPDVRRRYEMFARYYSTCRSLDA